MLINKDPKNSAKVKVSGAQLANSGIRYDFGQSGNQVAGSFVADVGNTFTLTVPAYTVTGVVIPKLQ